MVFITGLLTLILSLALLTLLLGVLVFVHELGHFLAAKYVGIRVNEFALGFGKSLWQKKYGETTYKLNLIPLGGYVSLEGEDGSGSDISISYANKSYWAKALVLLGGIFMNILLAFIVFAIYLPITQYRVTLPNAAEFNFLGAETKTTTGVLINSVLETSDFKDKFSVGEVIVAANNNPINNSEDWIKFLADNQGKPIELSLQDQFATNQRNLNITLPAERKSDGTLLGIGFTSFDLYILNYPANIFSSIPHSWNVFAYQAKVLGERISESFAARDASIVTDQVGSIVAVGAVVEEYVSAGRIEQILNLVALVSISLAFFNLLPLPALDGGHLFVITIEAITRKKVPVEIMGRINQIGFILLLLLGLFVIFKDVIQFDVLGRVGNLIKSIFPN